MRCSSFLNFIINLKKKVVQNKLYFCLLYMKRWKRICLRLFLNCGISELSRGQTRGAVVDFNQINQLLREIMLEKNFNNVVEVKI